MKKFEIEIERKNVTPAQFLAYVRSRVDAKGGKDLRGDLELSYFKAGNDLNFNHYHDNMHEISISKPYEMQTCVINADGTRYNEICEFTFDETGKTGSGYYYLVNVEAEAEATEAEAEQEAQPEQPEKAAEAEEAEQAEAEAATEEAETAIRLYGWEVEEEALYSAIQEAERSSFRTPAFRECVMLNTETGDLFQMSRYGNGSMTGREFDGIDVCLWETMDRQTWQPFGDYFCEGQNSDVINDFVRDVLSPEEWEEVAALAKEEECEPWQAVYYSENSRYYLENLNAAVCDECEWEMLSFLDPWEIISEIERRYKREEEAKRDFCG